MTVDSAAVSGPAVESATSTKPKPKPKPTGAGWSSTRSAWSFLAPFMVVYLIFILYPVIQAVWMGFYERDLLSLDRQEFIGVDNYVEMFWGDGLVWKAGTMWPWRIIGLLGIIPAVVAFRRGRLRAGSLVAIIIGLIAVFGVIMGIHPGEGGRWNDSQFWPSFGNTLVFVIMSTPVIVGVGLAMALALNRPGRLVGVLRTLFFAPYVLSVSVLTLIWAFLLSPQLGLIGAFWRSIGLEPVSWLTDPSLAMPTIVALTLWWTVGFNVVLFLAGLQDIDESQYEAASLDGANGWQRFRHITVPGLRRTLLLITVLQIIASFQIFGQVFILTRGGPNGATRVSIQHIYEAAFRDAQLGYASAMSVFLFVVMVGVSALQFNFMGGDNR